MGMLEDEAEKLRSSRATDDRVSSGVPVKLAGLSRRFGGLNKAAQDLRAKAPLQSPTVMNGSDHSLERGTSSKIVEQGSNPVQSGFSTDVLKTIDTESSFNNQGSNGVLSEGESGAKKGSIGVQTPFKQGSDSADFIVASSTDQGPIRVQTRSNQGSTQSVSDESISISVTDSPSLTPDLVNQGSIRVQSVLPREVSVENDVARVIPRSESGAGGIDSDKVVVFTEVKTGFNKGSEKPSTILSERGSNEVQSGFSNNEPNLPTNSVPSGTFFTSDTTSGFKQGSAATLTPEHQPTVESPSLEFGRSSRTAETLGFKRGSNVDSELKLNSETESASNDVQATGAVSEALESGFNQGSAKRESFGRTVESVQGFKTTSNEQDDVVNQIPKQSAQKDMLAEKLEALTDYSATNQVTITLRREIDVDAGSSKQEVRKQPAGTSSKPTTTSKPPIQEALFAQPKNQGSVGVETPFKQSANPVQSESNWGPDIPLNPVQTQFNQGSQVGSRNRLNPDISTFVSAPTASALTIVGSQRTILETIFNQCVMNGNSLCTPPISKTQLLALSGLGIETLDTALKRLRHKQMIARAQVKNGPGGWTQYLIAEETFRELAQIHFVSNAVQSGFNQGPQLGSNSSSKIDRASSAILEKDQKENLSISSWFFDLDFSGMPPGFKVSLVNRSIAVLAEQSFSREEIQDFVDRFPYFYASQNTSKIKSVVALFCTELQDFIKGDSKKVLEFKTDAELQAEAAWAERILKAKTQHELIARAQAEARRSELETDFECWWMTAAAAEKEELYPRPTTYRSGDDIGYKMAVKNVYIGMKMNPE